MSNEEADNMMSTFDEKDRSRARHEFIARMERKLHRKEHASRA